MPGIIGIVSGERSEKVVKDLDAMIKSMMHEPFYTSGKYTCEELGIYIGWVSHTGSFSDCMPVLNEKKDIVIIFSGEEFSENYNRFCAGNHVHGLNLHDASYLVHLYEEEDDKFFTKLNGWFSGVVIDHRQKCSILFNDRYGMHRIYYHEGKDELLFASEAKAILKVRENLRRIDNKSLGQFFSCDCVLGDQTLFSHINLFPAGFTWRINTCGSIKKKQYFDRTLWEDSQKLSSEDFLSRFFETFSTILPRYLVPYNKIGISLTSGFDTRMIMAWLDNHVGEFPCYTFTGMDKTIIDARIAKKIADSCHKKHEIIRLGSDFISEFPRFAEKTVYVTDGCHDVCGSHDIYFNESVREIAPIRITGKFGSEIVRNHSMLKKPLRLWRSIFSSDFQKFVEGGEGALQVSRKCDSLTFAVFKEVPWHEYGRLSLEQSKLTLRTPYLDNDLVELMYQAPEDLRATDEIPLRVVEKGCSNLINILTDRGQGGKSGKLISKTRKSLYYLLFKSEYIYAYQMPSILVRLDTILGVSGLERHMVGRYQLLNYRKLFRDELSHYIKDIIFDRRALTRPYLNRKYLEKIVQDHINGKKNYLNEINKVLTVELIYRQLLEQFT